LVPDDPVVVLTDGRASFRADDLIELARLVARLKT
jgi:hypothetical protein